MHLKNKMHLLLQISRVEVEGLWLHVAPHSHWVLRDPQQGFRALPACNGF